MSEAMLRGARMRVQVKFNIFAHAPDGTMGSCGIGAALEGAGVMVPADVRVIQYPEVIPASWLPLLQRGAVCPCASLGCVGPVIPTVWYMIAHLNNEHDWTRERIAKWLRDIENEMESRNHQQEPARQTQAEELSELVYA